MNFSYIWLKELFGIIKSSDPRVEKAKASIKGVVAGKILEIKKHPNADKLQLVRVDIGPSLLTSLPKGERKRMKDIQIVCGAWNIKVGDMVPVATVGTRLPNGLEIKEVEIRGERSQGMLCAQDELGLGTDHSGIMILNSESEIGSELLL